MKSEKQNTKITRGRPVKNIVLPIPATPDQVAEAIFQYPPQKRWDYTKS